MNRRPLSICRVLSLLVLMSGFLASQAPAAPSTVWSKGEGVLETCVDRSAPCSSLRDGREVFLAASGPELQVCDVVLGERSCPFVDRQRAVESLGPGDTLVLLPGQHSLLGGWDLRDLHGEECAPITIRGEEGAVLSSEVDVEWRLAETGPDGSPIHRDRLVFMTEIPGSGVLPTHGGSLEVRGLGEVALTRYPRWADFVSTVQDLRYVERRVPVVDDNGHCDSMPLSARDGDPGLYVGPGLFLDSEGRRIYLRLEPSDIQLRLGLASDPPDPSRAHLFRLLRLSDSLELHDVSHVVVRDLTIRGSRGLGLGGGTHHVALHDLRIDQVPARSLRIRSDWSRRAAEACVPGSPAASCVEGAPELCPEDDSCLCSTWQNSCIELSEPPHHIRLRNLHFDGGFPPWIYWTDMKSTVAETAENSPCEGWSFVAGSDLSQCNCESLGPSPDPVVSAVLGEHSNPGRNTYHAALLEISRNAPSSAAPDWPPPPYCVDVGSSTLEDGWFGTYVVRGERIRLAGNEMTRIHDDAVLIGDASHQIEVAHNRILNSFSAISSTGAGEADDLAEEGAIYLHHNVIDMRRAEDDRELMACVRPGPHQRAPNWNLFDIDNDGRSDGFCNNIVFAGHTEWGVRFDTYANTILVHNGHTYGGLSGVKQDAEATSPAHFASNILVQEAPDVPLYGGMYYDRFGGGAACPDSVGLQVVDGNIYWREGAQEVPCEGGSCCRAERLNALAEMQEEPQLFRFRGPEGYSSYLTLDHFRCGVPTVGTDQGLAERSACGYDLDCRFGPACAGTLHNERFSRLVDPRLRHNYRPQSDVRARVGEPAAVDWPESDWPWIGARAPWIENEDCVSFDPDRLTVEASAGRFRVVDRTHGLFSFDRLDDASRVRELLHLYQTDQSCFVGRPHPSLSYLLASGRAPVGPVEGEICRPFDPGDLEIRQAGGGWRVTLSPPEFVTAPTQGEAERVVESLQTHDFRQVCSVGQGAFRYFRR